MASKKTLYILRHAKAANGTDDHARSLADRGVKEAARMGTYLASSGIAPSRILCSDAIRTRETFKGIEKAYKAKLPVEYVDKLYLASANEMLKLIEEIPDTAERLLVIGHNPGLHELSFKLSKSGDDRLLKLLGYTFPPCSFVAIDLGAINWKDISHTSGKLEQFVTPDTLASA